MPKKNLHRPFTADPEMLARLPDITGNEINGVGEEQGAVRCGGQGRRRAPRAEDPGSRHEDPQLPGVKSVKLFKKSCEPTYFFLPSAQCPIRQMIRI